MWRGIPSALRFARSWTAPPRGLVRSEVLLGPMDPGSGPTLTPGRRDAVLRGLLVEPARDGPHPGWVVLHGMTRKGMEHPGLLRFVQSLASTGRRVLVPEVPAWVALDFAPGEAGRVIARAVEWLDRDPGTSPGGVRLVGFSFGAPQAVRLALTEPVGSRLRSVVGWGGYGSLESVFRFALTGRHSHGAETYLRAPDPYAAWLIGANCLPLCGSLRDREALVRGLHDLARESGDRQIPADHPAMMERRRALRASLAPSDRELLDLLSPEPGRPLAPERIAAAEELVATLVPEVREHAPLLDPELTLLPGDDTARAPLTRTHIRVRLYHGRADRMLPFTETLRLAEVTRARAPDTGVRILGRFGHSAEGEDPGPIGRTREQMDFLAAVREILTLG